MVDFNALLNRKYDILQQNADAATTRANSEAGLTNTRANLLPGQTQSEIALNAARGGLVQQETVKSDLDNQFNRKTIFDRVQQLQLGNEQTQLNNQSLSISNNFAKDNPIAALLEQLKQRNSVSGYGVGAVPSASFLPYTSPLARGFQ